MSDYELISQLGQGAMGRVHLARQISSGRMVALKVLHEALAADQGLQARFRREIALCARLNHPAIIEIYDAGEMDGSPYYTMEVLEGAQTLAELLADGPLELETAFDAMRALLDALAYCHGQAVIHRDIKPANLMLGPADRVTLMDFGLVRHADSTVLTKTGEMLGTPRYLPPEVILGGPQGVAGDLWSAGAVFYEMLTGRPAFRAQNIPDIVREIVHSDPPPVSQVLARLPASLDPLVARFLDKDPSTRYATAFEALQALDAWSVRQGVAPPESVLSSARLRRPVPRRTAKRKPSATTPRPRSGPAGAKLPATALAASLAAVVAAALVLAPRREALEPSRAAIPAIVDSATPSAPAPVSLAEAGSRLRHRLQLFDATSTLRWSSQEMQRFASQTHPDALPGPMKSAWTGHVTRALETSGLVEAVDQFLPVRDAYFLAADIVPETKRGLYEQIQLAIELFDAMKLLDLPVPFDAYRLESAAYGFTPEPLDVPLEGQAVLLERNLDARDALSLTPRTPLDDAVHAQGRLKAYADLRFAQGADAQISLLANNAYIHPRPLAPLEGPGAAELRVVLERTDPPLGVRFYTAVVTTADAKPDWKLLAFVRSRERRRAHTLRYRIPDGILPSSPYLVRVELAYVTARNVVKGTTEQAANVYAFALGRPAQR